MSNKTVIVILVVAAVLVGFIFLFERDTLTTSEQMARKGRVFTDFKKEAITSFALKGISGQEIVLKKVSGPTDTEETWRITAPRTLDADNSEVREILSALDFLLIDRAVHGADKIKDPAFALDSPRIQGRFEMRGKSIGFKVGADAQGDKVYFAVTTAPETVYAVSSDILTSLEKDLDDLRSKKLVKKALENVTAATLERPLGKVAMRKADKTWQVQIGAHWILAAEDQAGSLIRLVSELEASRFVTDDATPADLAKYGLDAPKIAIRLETEKDGPIAVRVGNGCDGEAAERYVIVEKSTTVACVKDDFSVVAERPLLRFEETRPVPVAVDDIEGLRIARNDHTLTMTFKDGKWQTDKGIALDADALAETLKALTETRGTQIDVGDAAVAALKGEKTEVTLTLADDQGTRTLFLTESGDTAKLQRKDEDAVLTFTPDILEKLKPDLLLFRSRTLVDKETDAVEKLVIEGPNSQTLEKQDGVWNITSPIAIAADSGAVRKLAELLAKLKADRFVAEKALKAHGLDKPFAVIEADFKGAPEHDKADHAEKADEKPAATAEKVILEIGAEAGDGKRFARLRNNVGPVFLIGDDFEYAINRPLIARDVLQVDETGVSALVIEGKSGTARFKKEKDIWKRDPEGPFKEDQLKRLLADIGGVKTVSATSFGPAEKGITTPGLTLTFTTKAGEAILTIGDRSANEKENGYLARKRGIDATFVIPTHVVTDTEALFGANTADNAADDSDSTP